MCRDTIVDSLECRVRDTSDRWERVSSWVTYNKLREERDRLEETGDNPDRLAELDEVLYEYSAVNSDLCTYFDILGGLRKPGEDFDSTAHELYTGLVDTEMIVNKWEALFFKRKKDSLSK